MIAVVLSPVIVGLFGLWLGYQVGWHSRDALCNCGLGDE